MKKFIVSILACFYLLLTSGVAVNFHYCMGKVRSMSFGRQQTTESCNKCGMTSKKAGCCEDKANFVKVDDTHHGSLVDINLHAPVMDVHHPQPLQTFQVVATSNNIGSTGNHSPPVFRNQPDLNTLHCVFRI